MQLLKQNDLRRYNWTVGTYSLPGSITVQRGCFSFMITNVGDRIARLNGMVVFPAAVPTTTLGDSRSVSGHLMDMFSGTLNLSFDAGVGVNPLVEIIQLFYIFQDE